MTLLIALVLAGTMAELWTLCSTSDVGPIVIGSGLTGILTLASAGMAASLYRQWRRGRNIDPQTANRIIHEQWQRDATKIQQLQGEINFLRARQVDAEKVLPDETG